MGRSGYSEDWDFSNWDFIRWRGVVASSIRGKRGQAFLRELVEALDAMPEKRLIARELQCPDGVCTIGSLGARRGIDMEKLDPEDSCSIAAAFGIAEPLVQEIEYMNDEAVWEEEAPEARWRRMRAWVAAHIARDSGDAQQGSK